MASTNGKTSTMSAKQPISPIWQTSAAAQAVLSLLVVSRLSSLRNITGLTLDIAGTAWKSGAAKGSTAGRPVSMLVQFY
ncbi:hypothetical protein OK016_06730 [Vibrio chagasii]|nr:hypothetical protein [Vibrio chagasii]